MQTEQNDPWPFEQRVEVPARLAIDGATAARLLNVSRSYIERAVNSGRLPARGRRPGALLIGDVVQFKRATDLPPHPDDWAFLDAPADDLPLGTLIDGEVTRLTITHDPNDQPEPEPNTWRERLLIEEATVYLPEPEPEEGER